MFQNVFIRLANKTRSIQTSVKYVNFLRVVGPLPVSARHLTDVKDARPFDTSLLEFLVCPLSKKQLRCKIDSEGSRSTSGTSTTGIKPIDTKSQDLDLQHCINIVFREYCSQYVFLIYSYHTGSHSLPIWTSLFCSCG
uniref:Phosphatidylinositol glycan anchor biosynthesis class Y n=1 Tax=Esox lucius TaxID=8010 RepID=A0AAY5K423_ESOLU